MGACKGRNAMKNEPPGHCYKCNVSINPGEKICCTCQDNTDGRNEHLFQIKYEINKESKWQEKGEQDEG